MELEQCLNVATQNSNQIVLSNALMKLEQCFNVATQNSNIETKYKLGILKGMKTNEKAD